MKRIYWVPAIALMGLSTGAHSRAPSVPVLTPGTIVGTWESIVPETLEFFVLQIDSLESAKVRLAKVSGPGTPVAVAFGTTKLSLDKAGRLLVTGSDRLRGDWVFELDLLGAGTVESATMRGGVRIWRSGDRRPTKSLSVVFTKNSERFTQWLARASAKADELLR